MRRRRLWNPPTRLWACHTCYRIAHLIDFCVHNGNKTLLPHLLTCLTLWLIGSSLLPDDLRDHLDLLTVRLVLA